MRLAWNNPYKKTILPMSHSLYIRGSEICDHFRETAALDSLLSSKPHGRRSVGIRAFFVCIQNVSFLSN